MDIESLREYCLSFPHATENVQWDDDLVFKVGGKMFLVAGLANGRVSFPCRPEVFAELTERDGIVPAPYVARYHWISLERYTALNNSEFRELVAEAYRRVFDKLPKKIKVELASSGS